MLGIDIDGRPAASVCYQNPDYRAWWLATVEDMFRTYELDGLQWGAECVGPLSNLMFYGTAPFCFCRHCRAQAAKDGIDANRAGLGFSKLYAFLKQVRAGQKPSNGVLTSIMNYFFRYPEILAWERLWRSGKEEIMAGIYRTAKAIRPSAEVGQHVDHQGSTYDLFSRSVVSYSEMTGVDFIQPILYHDIMGPRMRHWYLERLAKSIFSELSGAVARPVLFLQRLRQAGGAETWRA